MASRRRIRRKMQRKGCQKKVAYSTQEEASGAIWRTKKANRKRGSARAGRLSPYKCQFCGRWHVGHRKDAGDMIRLIDQVNR